jgi:CubicO group peptidase (beta-lactamase class C family)
MRRTGAALVLLGILAMSPMSAQQAPVFNRFELFSVLEVYLESLRQQAGIPGMSAAVVKDGTILWERGFGYQDLGARIRSTPDTPYVVGDMSGTLAAVLLLQCVEQRHLTLDDPVRRYDPSQTDPDVTLRQLLSHTSTEGINGVFQYNPERYATLTSLTERCIPQPYRKSVAHRVLRALAMKDSVPGTDLQKLDVELPEGFFTDAELEDYRRILGKTALPYRVDSRGRADRSPFPLIPMSATGGLVTTVRDLARFEGAIAPFPDPEIRPSLLLQPTLDVAWHQQLNRSGAAVPMGLGWFVQTHRGQRVVWHYGNVPNAYSSLLIRLPAYDLTFVLLANSDRLSAPYHLYQGDVSKSVFAALFLRLFT